MAAPGVALAAGATARIGDAAAPLLIGAIDGVLHNGDQLRRSLAADTGRDGDADLLLAAYLRWGEDFLDAVHGDFACALWDERAGRLILARDALGARPLHYCQRSDLLLFASEPRGLLAVPAVPMALDETRLAEFLTLLPPRNRSFFRGITALPPGHMLVAEGGRTRSRKWWKPLNRPMLRLGSDHDYSDALREALTQAVRRRLPEAAALGSHLSSGLDSTGVAALAARELAGQGRRLTALTAVPRPQFGGDGLAEVWDEGPMAARMAGGFANMDHVRVSTERLPLVDTLRHAVAILDEPPMTPLNVPWMFAIAGVAAERGISVMLRGSAGNASSSYDGRLLEADRLRRLRLGGLARDLADRRREGLGIEAVVGPFLPPPVVGFCRRALGRTDQGPFDRAAISPALARDTGVTERMRDLEWRLYLGCGGDPRLARLRQLELDVAFMSAGLARGFGVDYRDPTADRALVELCLSIPEEQFRLGGQPRSLIRRALAGLVPEEILAQRRRAIQAADWPLALDEARPAIAAELAAFAASPLCRHCLDLDRMDRLMEAWPKDGWHRPEIATAYRDILGRTLVAGLFIRRIEEEGSGYPGAAAT